MFTEKNANGDGVLDSRDPLKPTSYLAGPSADKHGISEETDWKSSTTRMHLQLYVWPRSYITSTHPWMEPSAGSGKEAM